MQRRISSVNLNLNWVRIGRSRNWIAILAAGAFLGGLASAQQPTTKAQQAKILELVTTLKKGQCPARETLIRKLRLSPSDYRDKLVLEARTQGKFSELEAVIALGGTKYSPAFAYLKDRLKNSASHSVRYQCLLSLDKSPLYVKK